MLLLGMGGKEAMNRTSDQVVKILVIILALASIVLSLMNLHAEGAF